MEKVNSRLWPGEIGKTWMVVSAAAASMVPDVFLADMLATTRFTWKLRLFQLPSLPLNMLTQGGKKVATADYNYAQSRVRFVRKLLLETLAPETTQQTELSSKFIEFVLGTERPLTLETFSAMPQATVWWSEKASRNVSQALKDLKPGKPSPGRSVAENDINRSVALFAVPRECLRLP